MAIKLSLKLFSIKAVLVSCMFVAACNAWAGESVDLTAEILTVGMTYGDVKVAVDAHPLTQRTSNASLASSGKPITALGEIVDIDPSHQLVVLSHLSAVGDGNGRLLSPNETLLIFKNHVLVSKELSGYRWEAIRPLALNGVPGIVASHWSGGAHCCYTNYVVALSPMPIITQELNLQDDPGRLTTCGNQTCLRLTDYTFAYWRGAFVDSIGAEVLMSLRGDAFYFDPDLMHKPDLTTPETTIKKIQQAFQKTEQPKDIDIAYRMLGQELLTSIYYGQASKAEDLIRRIWPHPQKSNHEQEFVTEFINRLKRSPYWNDLVLLNGGDIFGTK